jgi:hypothetical protein
MMKSRMEIGSEQDYSKTLCSCGHSLGEHDWPASECKAVEHYLNVFIGRNESTGIPCECKNFEHAIETEERFEE